jgi:halimadienyl-diphosphate synthase
MMHQTSGWKRLQTTIQERPHWLEHISYSQPVPAKYERAAADLMSEMGNGRTTNTAYDTAWVARLHQQGEPMAAAALDWLRDNQLPDGSWGAPFPRYHHDRAISTLVALLALAEAEVENDIPRIEKGLKALADHMTMLELDTAGETIGFEMLLPTLISEAAQMGLVRADLTPHLAEMLAVRRQKLANAPGGMISREVTMAFSAEMAGRDGTHLFDLSNLQERDGSIGYSPAATAYYLLHIAPQDENARSWLRTVFHAGGAPNVGPITVFEPAWIIWNLATAGWETPQFHELSRPFIESMEAGWDRDRGIGTAFAWQLTDSDDTAMVYDVLARFRKAPGIKPLLNYETETHFRCFPLEKNPSISANIHILGAMRQAGYLPNDPRVEKIIQFLFTQQHEEGYWLDKWHASPMYVTARLIINSLSYRQDLLPAAINWMLKAQRRDGSWGYYGATLEETAYCLQALALSRQAGWPVPRERLAAAAAWLRREQERLLPPLWIGKSLYSPPLVIRSAILSALILEERLE